MNQLTALQDRLHSVEMSDPDGFSDVFGEFMDLTGLVDVSKPCKDKGIRSLLELVARRHTNDPELDITNILMLQYAPAGLFHGGFFAGTGPGTFFYFVKAQQGIVALSHGPIVHYYRISATLLPPGTTIGRKRWTMN